MRIATLALCLAGASAFVGPAAPRRLPLHRRAVAELVATGEALVRSQALAGELGAPGAVLEALPSSDVLVAFADQGGNLAGKFFMGSLPPYALFLYFLNYEGNNAPPRAKFPTSKAHISVVFHSFRLIFGRAIISRNGLEAWMLFPEHARAKHSR